jgi:hypothetical protein
MVNGTISSNHTEIREHIVQFKRFNWQPRLDDLSFGSVREDEAIW